MAVLVLLSLAVPTVTHALTGSDSDNSSSSTEAENETETENETTETTAQKQKRSERVEAYKKELKETLTNAIKTRIGERCVAAQGLTKKRVTANKTANTVRTSKFNEIVTKLEAVVTAYKAKNIDTSTLEANIVELKAKITSYSAADETYRQSLSDLTVLDCKTDPVAFKAALEKARTDQKAALTAAKAIRSYLTDTVKTTLKSLKTTSDQEE